MQLQKEQIVAIKSKFAEMQTVDEFVELLNFVNPFLYPEDRKEKIQPIQKKSVTFYGNYELSRLIRYKEFSIKKKNGGERIILSPNPSLKLIQRTLNFILSLIYEPREYVTGFVKNRNIVENAKLHVGKKYVFNIDLENFFPSIELHRVKAVLKLPPFDLKDDKREKLAFLMANLCCHVEDNEKEILPKYTNKNGSIDATYLDELKTRAFLPQGAPTSPVLSNIICQKLDRRLNGLAKKTGAKYSRYADDITFSCDADVFNKAFKTEMRRIVTDQNFIINESKVRLKGIGYKQEVTGLTVNEKVNVSKKYVRDVRAMLNNIEKLGLPEAEQRFFTFYTAGKGHVKKSKPSMLLVLWGKLQFLSMVRGKDDAMVVKYISQFGRVNSSLNNTINISTILSVWEAEGIEQAMKLYYSNENGHAEK